MSMTTFLWLLVVVGGPVLIGVVIAYALMTKRRLSYPEKAAQKDAVDHLYDRK